MCQKTGQVVTWVSCRPGGVCDKPDSKVSIHQRSLGVSRIYCFSKLGTWIFNIERLHL